MSAVHIPEIPAGASKLDAALAYAAAGIAVLAVAPGTKNPGSLVGGDWERAASTDPAVLRGWFSGEAGERRGIGICPGPSGLVVLDVDRPDHADAVTLRDSLADAPAAETRPGTGRVHLFARQAGGKRIGCPRVPWGDVRGWGGFVMVYPSVNPDNGGQQYGPITAGPVPALPRSVSDTLPEKGTQAVDPMQVEEAWSALYQRDWEDADPRLARQILAAFRRDLDTGRHTALINAVTWAVKAAWAGKIDPLPLLSTIRREFVAAATDGPGARDAGEAQTEVDRAVTYAVQTAEAEAVQPLGTVPPAGDLPDGAVQVGGWTAVPVAALENVERAAELVEDTLPPASVGQLIGVSYVGKSYLAVSLAMSLATDAVTDWCGRRILAHGGVAYWLLEGAWDFGLRVRAWKDIHGVTPDHPVMVLEGPGGVTVPDEQARFLALLREAFPPGELRLIVIDTQSLAFSELDENSNSDMTRMLKACRRIADETGATVLLVHHASPKGEGVNRRDPGRGASAQFGGSDFILYASREQPEHGEPAPPGTLSLDKYKAYKPWTAPVSYTFEQVDLGTDAAGRELSSSVVIPDGVQHWQEEPPAARPAPVSVVTVMLLQILQDRGPLSAGQLALTVGCGRRTVAKHVGRLVDAGSVVVTGSGATTRYQAVET